MQQVLAAYLADPAAAGPAVLELARPGLDRLPPALLLIVADAFLRAGQPRAARAALTAPGAPPEWAEPGCAWIALMSGDLADAHARYAHLAEQGRDAMPRVIVALLDAANGRTSSAVEALDEVAADPSGPPKLREVAALGAAYAHLWARDLAPAEIRFGAVAAQYPGTSLTDDARYGVGVAQFRRGDLAGATAVLQELAGPDGGPAHASRDLLNLRPGAILRAGRRRYSRMPFQFPVDGLRSVLDVNGRTLARAALRRVEAGREPLAGDVHEADRRDRGAAVAPRPGDRPQGARPGDASPAAPPGARARPTPAASRELPERRRGGAVVGGILIVVLLAIAWQRRARSGTSARGRVGRR